MLFDSEELNTSVMRKFGETVNCFCELKTDDTFIVDPAGQLSLFNFLFYEQQWKFSNLEDIVLMFNPGWHHCEYALRYSLSSNLFDNKLNLLLPVDFSSSHVYSVVRPYKNAHKFEEEITGIYGIQFVAETSKLAVLKKRFRTKLHSFARWFHHPDFSSGASNQEDLCPKPG